MVSIKILYEDNHLLAVEKPVNLPTQADRTGDPDLLSLLKADLKQRYQKPGNVYLGLIHRLDRPVGGAIVFAKTSKAASRLSEQVRSRQMEKEYLAVCHGVPDPAAGHLKHFLIKDSLKNQVSVAAASTPGAKPAELDYRLLAEEAGFGLLEIALKTGRSHQIRVQLAAIGHPLFGDQKYGAALNCPGQQLALWSRRLAFSHPVSKAAVVLCSVPPAVYPWNLFNVGL